MPQLQVKNIKLKQQRNIKNLKVNSVKNETDKSEEEEDAPADYNYGSKFYSTITPVVQPIGYSNRSKVSKYQKSNKTNNSIKSKRKSQNISNSMDYSDMEKMFNNQRMSNVDDLSLQNLTVLKSLARKTGSGYSLVKSSQDRIFYPQKSCDDYGNKIVM